jgi:drug/metabolite transporter (DMT)-like permease
MKTLPRPSFTALFVLLSIVFASDLVVTKFGLGGTPPLMLAGLRYLVGGLVLAIIMIAFRRTMSLSLKDLVGAIFLGVLGTVEFGSLYLGMQYISAGTTSVLYYTQPIMVAVLAAVFLNEAFSWNKAAAILFGFVGVVLIFVENLSGGLFSFGWSLVLVSAFSWAVATIVFKKLVRSENFLAVTSVLLVLAGSLLLTFSISFEAAPILSLRLAFALMYLALVGSAFGIALWAYLLRHNEATRVSTWLFLVPVLGVLLGWLLLDESIYITEIVGVFCVGLSIFILNR